MKMTKQSNDFPGFRFLINGQDAKVGETVEVSVCCGAALSKRGWVQAAYYKSDKPTATLAVKADAAHDADKPKTRRTRTFDTKEK